MSALWSDLDPILDDPMERKHDQEEKPQLSKCCEAPLLSHWPCEQKMQCSACKDCALCGEPSDPEFERNAIWPNRPARRRQ
jgi:hypothetical protein